MTHTRTDQAMMARALVLAERGRDTVRPNPMVGCVLVRDGEIVGEGYHARPGGPHAEVVALANAGEQARGATAYVSLEPCDHTGRTGPCSSALIEAGVARVLYALSDPDPLASGGHGRLVGAGVEVRGGLLEAWALTQNEVFVHSRRTGRPHITLKLAQSLDGQLTVRGRTWITGEVARRSVHERRAKSDAVLVGSGTVLADDPMLNVRAVEATGGQPRAVVLDSRGRVPLDAKVVREGTIIVTTEASESAWVDGLRAAGVEVLVVGTGPDGHLDLEEALAGLCRLDVLAVLAEPGAELAASLVRNQVVDRLVSHIAVTLIGPYGTPRMTPVVDPPEDAGWVWRTERTGYLGADLEVVSVPDVSRIEDR